MSVNLEKSQLPEFTAGLTRWITVLFDHGTGTDTAHTFATALDAAEFAFNFAHANMLARGENHGTDYVHEHDRVGRASLRLASVHKWEDDGHGFPYRVEILTASVMTSVDYWRARAAASTWDCSLALALDSLRINN